jgi:FKBP-type peptidyl-prolyl cis-trans isomerase SlyD
MKSQIISFHCVLKDQLGQVISSSFNNDVLTENVEVPLPAGAYSDFHEPLKVLVEGLRGLKTGEKRSIFVRAESAYGFYDPDLVMTVPRKRLPNGELLDIGFQVITQADDGEQKVFRIIASDTQNVTLDGNHPLAGQDLLFDVEATAARDATREEIAGARTPIANKSIH